jgi:hypothetical protein
MRHPFEQFNLKDQKYAYIILLSATILIMIITNVCGAPLKTASAPYGIISFEFAFSPERTQEVISSWSPEAQIRAAFIQGLDFLFPLVYAAALSVGCLLAANSLSASAKPLSKFGVPLA